MKFITESIKETPVLTEVDVVVVGGGVLTQVGIEGYAWYRHQETIEAGGLAKEFEQTAKDMDGTTPEPQSDSEAIDA